MVDETKKTKAQLIDELKELHKKVLHLEKQKQQYKLINERLKAFESLGQKLSEATTQKEAAKIIVDAAEELIGWDACFVDLYDKEKDLLYPILIFDTIDNKKTEFPVIKGKYTEIDAEVLRDTIDKCGQLVLRENNQQPDIPEAFGDTSRRSSSLMFVPIRETNKVVGMLSIQSYTKSAYTEENLKTLQLLADHCGGALDRIRVEADFRESQEKHRLLVENVNDGIVISQNDIFIFINKRFSEMLGYEYDELIMKDYREVYTAQSVKILMERSKRRNRGEEVPSRYETVFRKKDNSELYVEANVAIIDYRGNQATFAVIRDISDRKRLERERECLQRLSQKLTSSLTVKQIGKILANESRFLFRYDAFLFDIFDAKTKKLYGAYYEDTPYGGDNPVEVHIKPEHDYGEHTTDILNGGPQLINLEEGENSDNFMPFGFETRISLSVIHTPIHWEKVPIGFLSIQSYEYNRYNERDLNLLKTFAEQCGGALTRAKAQEEIITAHNIYRRTIENTNGVPYQLDFSTNKYVFIGEGCEQLLGIPSEELTLDKVKSLLKEVKLSVIDAPKDLNEYLKKFLKGEIDRYQADLRIILANGEEKWINDCSIPVKDEISGKITGSAGILQDITYRKQIEDKMLQSSRMEATATLAGGIAHDFNNLMVGVLGNAQLLKMNYCKDQDELEMLSDISKAAQRASELAQQMLAYARGGKYQLKVMNLNTIINETLRLQERSLPMGVKLMRSLEPELWNIEADPTQMHQVIMNFCINAVEASKTKGLISITTRNIEITKSEETPELKTGRYVYLSVKDSGCGISRENQAKVFEPFFTTKFQGRGLGLSAVYGIIKNHNGHIVLESETDKGTTFTVFLPACDKILPEQREKEKEVISGTETILVIDDEETVLKITKRFLENHGYKVLTAINGKEAVETAKTYKDEIHLAILDMGMPEMTGEEAFPLLMEARPDMKVIICSGYEMNKASRNMLKSGASTFIKKPFRLVELGKEIRQALDE